MYPVSKVLAGLILFSPGILGENCQLGLVSFCCFFFFTQLTLRKWWEEVSLMNLWWWALPLLSLFFTCPLMELGSCFPWVIARWLGPVFSWNESWGAGKLRWWWGRPQNTRNWRAVDDAWTGKSVLGAQVPKVGLFQQSYLRSQRLWDGLPC